LITFFHRRRNQYVRIPGQYVIVWKGITTGKPLDRAMLGDPGQELINREPIGTGNTSQVIGNGNDLPP